MEVIQNQIYCIVPFYFDTPFDADPGDLWVSQVPAFDTDAMYPFLNIGAGSMRVYAPDFDRNANLRKFWQQTSRVVRHDGTDTGLTINLLRASGNSWRTPRLVISQSGEDGMLIVPMTVSRVSDTGETADPTSTDICNFVNGIQKYDTGQTFVMTYRTKGKTTILQDTLDKDLNLCVKDRPHSWTPGALIEMLLRPLPDTPKMFKPYRAHVFTYILGDTSSASLTEDEKGDFLRIVHCQNHRYHIDTAQIDSPSVMRTFNNILTGVSVEGACVMALMEHDEGDSFLESYGTGSLQTRLLWMYFTLLMQRHVLLDIDRRLTLSAPEMENPEKVAEVRFRKAVALSCTSRLTGVFTSVSGYTHHNTLYQYIARNLDVKALYGELDEKLRAIDTWLRMVEEERGAAEAVRRKKFETFIEQCGVLLAVMGLLYAIPQSIPTLVQAWTESMWISTLICVVPAVAAVIWLIVKMKRSQK